MPSINLGNKKNGMPNVSIRSRPKSAKQRARYLANKAARASLYAAHTGSNDWAKNVGAWHDTLKALSLGTL